MALALNTNAQQQQQTKQAWWQRSVAHRTEAFVQAHVDNMSANCRHFKQNPYAHSSIALLDRSEIVTSNLLGKGSFSEVYKVYAIRLQNASYFDAIEEEARDAITKSTKDTNGDCTYVIKHLRHDLGATRTKFHHAAADIVLEARFLSTLDHPNICKIRGLPAGGAACFSTGRHDSYFLILDRLDETLAQRLVRWKKEMSATTQGFGTNEISNLALKADYALQIAQALDYLHAKDIIFRDLKPDNIGLKGDRVQLFDFGLYRELPEEAPTEDKVFHMSGVGTRRYMAPEVYRGEHYNLKADVYSWAMVFHSMLSLQRPYEMYSPELHRLLVCQDGIRPTVFPEWPTAVQSVLTKGWAHDPSKRLTMKEVCERVSEIYETASKQVAVPSAVAVVTENLSGACSALFFDNLEMGQQIKTFLRVVEMHMMEEKRLRPETTPSHPHLQHLRSAYL